MTNNLVISKIVAIGALGWLGFLVGNSNAQEKPIEAIVTPGENLVVEGVPPIAASLADQVRRYTEARGAAFYGWHPSRREMLIGTRFANSTQVHLVKSPGAARTQLTFFNEPVGSASFEPQNGKYIIFSRDTGGNEFAQLYRFDNSDGNITLLTDGGRSQNGGLHWNNGKDKVAFASTQRNGTDRDIWIINPLKPEIPAENKVVVENVGGGWGVEDWSHDDKQLCLIESKSINQSRIYLVDVSKGTKKLLTDDKEEVAYGAAQFSHDGKSLWVTTDKDSEFQRLSKLNLADGKLTPITTKIPWDVESIELSPDGKKLAFVANEAGVSKLYMLDTSTLEYQIVSGLPTGVVSLGDWHSSGKDLAFTLNSARSTSDVYTLSEGKVVRWTESELGGLISEQLSEPTVISWKSFDGLQITGFQYLPSQKYEGKRPVIINIHGGPEGQSRPLFLARNNYFLNELGVAIIYPNVRGSAGYGKTFVKLDNGLKRLDSVKDIGALLDWIATQPHLDSSKIMITGGSYGGYMTLACAVEYNERIKCSLDVVGISHFGTFLKNTESYRRDLRRVEYGDERITEIADFFEKMAPLNNAGKITKPLFVVQGGNDPRVPLSEAEQMVAKVKANGSPIWYVMAKDEGHGFRKKNNADFQFYATVLFVRKHLLE